MACGSQRKHSGKQLEAASADKFHYISLYIIGSIIYHPLYIIIYVSLVQGRTTNSPPAIHLQATSDTAK